MIARPKRQRNDLSLYEDRAAAWWDDRDPSFRSLRSVTEFRLALLRSWVPDESRQRVADLGCGGGLLAAPLSNEGAQVFGVDWSPSSLEQARLHSAADSRFWCGDLTATPWPSASMDVVLLADVLEHLPTPARAFEEAARLLRPHGYVYVSTINRTVRAHVLAVTLAEGLGFVPRGTHDPAMFLKPAEIDAMAAEAGLGRQCIQGEGVRLLSTLRERRIRLRPSRSVAGAYSALYRKVPAGETRS